MFARNGRYAFHQTTTILDGLSMVQIRSLDAEDELFEFCLPEFTEANDLDDYIRRIIEWGAFGTCKSLYVEGRGGNEVLKREVRKLRIKYPFWNGQWVIFDFGDSQLKRDIVEVGRTN